LPIMNPLTPKTNKYTGTDLLMKKCMLIPLYGDGNNYNVESQLPIIPRVGDHIELDNPHDKGRGLLFRVVVVGFANDEHVEYVDVYLRPAAPLHEMISRWSKA